MDVPTAALALGISSPHAYRLLREERFPLDTIRVGQSCRVITAGLIRVLQLDADSLSSLTGTGGR